MDEYARRMIRMYVDRLERCASVSPYAKTKTRALQSSGRVSRVLWAGSGVAGVPRGEAGDRSLATAQEAVGPARDRATHSAARVRLAPSLHVYFDTLWTCDLALLNSVPLRAT